MEQLTPESLQATKSKVKVKVKSSEKWLHLPKSVKEQLDKAVSFTSNDPSAPNTALNDYFEKRSAFNLMFDTITQLPEYQKGGFEAVANQISMQNVPNLPGEDYNAYAFDNGDSPNSPGIISMMASPADYSSDKKLTPKPQEASGMVAYKHGDVSMVHYINMVAQAAQVTGGTIALKNILSPLLWRFGSAKVRSWLEAKKLVKTKIAPESDSAADEANTNSANGAAEEMTGEAAIDGADVSIDLGATALSCLGGVALGAAGIGLMLLFDWLQKSIANQVIVKNFVEDELKMKVVYIDEGGIRRAPLHILSQYTTIPEFKPGGKKDSVWGGKVQNPQYGEALLNLINTNDLKGIGYVLEFEIQGQGVWLAIDIPFDGKNSYRIGKKGTDTTAKDFYLNYSGHTNSQSGNMTFDGFKVSLGFNALEGKTKDFVSGNEEYLYRNIIIFDKA